MSGVRAASLARTTDRTGTCAACRQPIVWAWTWHADDPRHKRKHMPLDSLWPDENDPSANVAVSRDGHGTLLARVLRLGEEPMATERRARVHMATCTARHAAPSAPEPVADVIPLRPRGANQ